MSQLYKILIVDDHPMVAYGTKMIVQQVENVLITGIAETGEQCMELLAQTLPELILLDYNLPDCNGSELTSRIKEKYPFIHIVIFSGDDLIHNYNNLLDLDISGILGKNANEEQLKNMIRSIRHGQTVIPLTLFKQLRITESGHQGLLLTHQEMEMLAMLTNGLTQEQIAEAIFSSKRSVDNYFKKIYDKIGVKNKAMALKYYYENKLN